MRTIVNSQVKKIPPRRAVVAKIPLSGNLQGQSLGIALGLLAAVVYAVYILLAQRPAPALASH